MRRTTKAFWQGVAASVVSSLILEGLKIAQARARRAAADSDMTLDDVRVGDSVPPLAFLDDLPPAARLSIVAAAGLLLGLGVFLLLQRMGLKAAAVVLPIVAVLVVGVVYLALM